MPSAPAIFVSSTYFDLKQVRSDIGRVVRDLGYGDLRSELDTFPINPDLKTIDNCRGIVEREADIFVLIIGGRYGFVEEDAGKSVTNLEYLTARSKGIPVYVFVQKDVLALLPTYGANPSADFSASVQNAKVFEFIKQVREKDGVWTFGFEDANEIAMALKSQLAGLFKDALGYRKAISAKNQEWLRTLSPQAFRLAVEQPKSWEARLFCQILADKIESFSDLRDEYRYGIALGSGDHIPITQFPLWSAARLGELTRIVEGLSILFNQVLSEAFGAPGVPGEAKKIYFAATNIAEVYRQFLEWSKSIRRATFPLPGQRVQKAMARFPEKMIESIEAYGTEALKKIETGLSEGTREKPAYLNLNLLLEFYPGDYEEALEDWVEWAERHPEDLDRIL